ncbi:TPA: transcriptional regulator [Proteus mirabilis]|nr:transcriptional regulator [Proteus mirabilis]OFV21126.1 transcriptional regulator [Proteus sp. HMSC14B05]QHN12494.1 transcriptional regulator [Proteus columbae]MBG3071554.1 transcriptional regulator [Proteus mirabilis]MBI6428235.1 transcriptional regulator [Proteus mirabilis]
MSGALPRDCEPKDNAPKDDIMNRVVNHAHQRNPNKKW